MVEDSSARTGETVVACDVCGEAVPMKVGQSGPGSKPTHPRCR